MTSGVFDGEGNGGRAGPLRASMEIERLGGVAQGPERELFIAILYDAIQVLLNSHPLGHGDDARRYREAVWWIESLDNDYIFSFESVCEALGIDADYLRAGLQSPKVTRLQKVRKGSAAALPEWIRS